MSKFQVGERVAPHNWPSMPPAAGGVVTEVQPRGQETYFEVLWDNGPKRVTLEKFLRPEMEGQAEAPQLKQVTPGVNLNSLEHGIDCESIEWGYDGIEGESGLPCNCWRAVLGLPETVENGYR